MYLIRIPDEPEPEDPEITALRDEQRLLEWTLEIVDVLYPGAKWTWTN